MEVETEAAAAAVKRAPIEHVLQHCILSSMLGELLTPQEVGRVKVATKAATEATTPLGAFWGPPGAPKEDAHAKIVRCVGGIPRVAKDSLITIWYFSWGHLYVCRNNDTGHESWWLIQYNDCICCLWANS